MLLSLFMMLAEPVIVLPPPPAPPVPVAAGMAMPLSNPGSWVTTADYPPDSLRQGEEGAVGFALDINRAGMVENCIISQSSGYPALDQAACDLIRRRARFRPAQDASGAPVIGHYANRVRWVIPKQLPQPVALERNGSMVVLPDGRFAECRMETVTGPDAGNTRTPCELGQRTQPFLDENGKPVARRVRIVHKVTLEPVP